MDHADELDPGVFIDAIESLGDVIIDAAIAGLAEGWDTFNPSLTITGLIQPVIFGIPLGAPSAELQILINKDQVSFSFEGSQGCLNSLDDSKLCMTSGIVGLNGYYPQLSIGGYEPAHP